jgi:hypothetical protein
MPWRNALTLAVLLTACSGKPSGAAIEVGGESVPTTQLAAAAAGICQAAREAGSDVAAARTTFYDRSHREVHTIAAALDRDLVLEKVTKEVAPKAMAMRAAHAK